MDSPFRACAQLLFGRDAVGQGVEYFDKSPHKSQPTPPHQDGYYFMIQPCEALTMWLAIDDVDETNGCLRYLAGSQREGIRAHAKTNTLGFSQGLIEFDELRTSNHEIACCIQAGDMLVHDARTVHWADKNNSLDRHRRSLGLVFYSDRVQADTQGLTEYRENLERELASEGKI